MKIIALTIIILIGFCEVHAQKPGDIECPSISVTGPSSVPLPGEIQKYTAEIGQVVERYNVEYVWSISTGKIVSGQGTKSIEVLTEKNENLTATIEVKGLPAKCPNMASETGNVSVEHNFNPVKSDVLENFGWSGTKGHLDNFFVELQNDKGSTGNIVFYRSNQTLKQIKFLRDYALSRRFPLARITITIDNDRSGPAAEFHRVPPGGNFDLKNGISIKLMDFEDLEQIFKPAISKPKKKK